MRARIHPKRESTLHSCLNRAHQGILPAAAHDQDAVMGDNMRKLCSCKPLLLACVFCSGVAAVSPAQDYPFATLVSLSGSNGKQPLASVIQGSDGNFYGTTSGGGASGNGTVFKMTSTGTLTTLYNFCSQTNCTDGFNPTAALVQGTDGNFYGTTSEGGAFEHPPNAPALGGTVFKITPSGLLTTLYSFCLGSSNGVCLDGNNPLAALILGTDGNLYGTTNSGGANGSGTVFRITPTGTLTTLYNFCSRFTTGVINCTDGARPATALVQDSSGNLYGTTQAGGAGTGNPTGGLVGGPGGTVFEIVHVPGIPTNINPHPEFALITLYSFCNQPNCADGETPTALVQAANGNFYGTTYKGGATGAGTVFEIFSLIPLTVGTARESSTKKLLTVSTLYTFCSQTNCTDGQNPTGLVQGSNGDFYGTTSLQGGHSGGTVFEITPGGSLTTLHGFCSESNCTDGQDPTGLAQAENGNLYGTTFSGGANGDGTVFGLPASVPPICNGEAAYFKLFPYYRFRADISVSNGNICQFFGGGVRGVAPIVIPLRE
jgi:uncharacterized repeat protein (TIGR03803 family)